MAIEIHGLAELQRRLKALPKEMQEGNNSPVWLGLRWAGNVIRDKAKALAPVDTGALRDSIRTRKRPKKINKIRNNDNPAMQVVPYKKQHIAYWNEFGTGKYFRGTRVFPPRGGDPTKVKPRTKKILFDRGGNEIYGAFSEGLAPKPFFRPALERGWKEAVNAFAKGFESKLKTLERRYAKR